MPAKTTWSWVEAYGEVEVDPDVVHGSDWNQARLLAAKAIEQMVPSDYLESVLRVSKTWAEVPARDIIQQGSGWGALEEVRRVTDDVPVLDLPGVFFPESSLGPDQAPWLALLKTGVLPEVKNPLDEPGCFVSHAEWLDRLERSLERPSGRHWNALFHLGVLYWQAGRTSLAVQSWELSCKATENPWSRRCLGAAEVVEKRFAEAVLHLRQAFEMKPSLRPLVIEYLSALLEDKQYETVLEFDNDGTYRQMDSTGLLPVGSWTYVTVAVDETETNNQIRVYFNGTLDSTPAYAGAMPSGTSPMQIGNYGQFNGGVYQVGILDEVRVSPLAQSSNWVWACYQNMASNAVFQSYGKVVWPPTGTVVQLY